MAKIHNKLKLLVGITLLIMLIPTPEPTYAQWPPFNFNLLPSFEDGKITYDITFESWVTWTITDVTYKIPIPKGTRYLEANTSPMTTVNFDGEEVTFSTSLPVHRYGSIPTVSFVVEVTDPTKTIFTTQAWVAWKGEQPGDYLGKEVSIDITQQSLDWAAPPIVGLQLEAGATSADEVITYNIFARKVGWSRMWDLRVKVPIPEGTTFLSAKAPSQFVTDFDGREVTFSIPEMDHQVEVPLSFTVSTQGVSAPFVKTHAWAVWKNAGWGVGTVIPLQEETQTGNIIVQPHTSQLVVADLIGDVPLSNYDLTSVALEEDKAALKITYHTVGDVGPVGGEPLIFSLYIDSDCNFNTGRWNGVEYWVKYYHSSSGSDFHVWDEENGWRWVTNLDSSVARGNMISVRLPYDLLNEDRQFCWEAEALNTTEAFNPSPPPELVPNSGGLSLNRYDGGAPIPAIETEAGEVVPSRGTFIDIGDTWQYLPGWSEPPLTWKSIGFDDSDWFSGPTSIGYGEGNYATDLSGITRLIQKDTQPTLVQRDVKQAGAVLAMLPSGADDVSIFARRAFTVTYPLNQLTLEIDYAGGFVAYLNGTEVARRGLGNPGSPIIYDALTANHHPAGTPEVIDLSDYITSLVTGTNILAVQVHRSANVPLNLSVAPKLTWQNNPAKITVDNVDIALSGEANEPVPASPIAPSFENISGKLAVPLDNGRVAYDVHIFSLPGGKEIVKIPNARQPNFRFDGQRMLINHEGGGVENVFEYNLADGTEKQVSDAPQDWHPFYDPLGNRVVYGNSELTVGSPEPLRDEDGKVVKVGHNGWAEVTYYSPRKPFIFVQCGLLPPHQESDPRCRNIPWLGVLVPAGQMGEIQGTHPVWTANDTIAYKGCNSWAGFSLCGIYIVPASSTKGFSDGFIPRQLTRDTSDTPSDTKGNLIAFTSRRDGNWEAYVMDLNGAGVKNLSNSPDSNDGLPTISPDGNWVAFVSDRDDQWAVWVVPVTGGPAQKLFDLPVDIPWGDGDRVWTNERISWGP